jgi:hypothetical protein
MLELSTGGLSVVRCMCTVAGKYIWCGIRNKVHVIDPAIWQLKASACILLIVCRVYFYSRA